jgi:exopolysaccharide biosynthesis polyprenyl glycosylphosphotransferase
MRLKIKSKKQRRNIFSSYVYAITKIKPQWWMLYDIVAIVLAMKLIHVYPLHFLSPHIMQWSMVIAPALFILGGNILGLYDKATLSYFIKLIATLLFSTSFVMVGLVLLWHIAVYPLKMRGIVLALGAIIFLLCGILRAIGFCILRHKKIKILFIGTKQQYIQLIQKFSIIKTHYRFLGFCNDGNEETENKLGKISDIVNVSQMRDIDLVVVDNAYVAHSKILEEGDHLAQLACIFTSKADFIEQVFEQVDLDKVDFSWIGLDVANIKQNIQFFLKRLFDVIISILGLGVTILLLPLIWISIRIASPGSVFYSQNRVGYLGKSFRIYKFRTMKMSAENGEAVWAKKKDDRVTSIGKLLRTTRLDELPQFWNILLGQMSFVGPRPERPELVQKIETSIPSFSLRNLMKPGITGFAQIKYRYGASIEDAEEKLKYDLYYIKHWSIFLDIGIILRTIALVTKGSR